MISRISRFPIPGTLGLTHGSRDAGDELRGHVHPIIGPTQFWEWFILVSRCTIHIAFVLIEMPQSMASEVFYYPTHVRHDDAYLMEAALQLDPPLSVALRDLSGFVRKTVATGSC